MAEWSNALDSKSSVRVSRTVGSNPTLSASAFESGDCAHIHSTLFFLATNPVRPKRPLNSFFKNLACTTVSRSAAFPNAVDYA